MTTRISANEDQRRRHAPLVEIGHIEIPPTALEHRFFREARVLTQWVWRNKNHQERIIGTKNTRECELYGWTNDIPPHHDRTGFIYLCSLTTASSLLVVNPDDEDPNEHAKLLTQGTVLRLDDLRTHWTYDDGLQVCAFVGSFEQPDDARAMTLLTHGIQALAAGRYQGAPRVSDGYRVPLEDECYATADFMNYELMLIDDAHTGGLEVLGCAKCGKPARHIDHHWPYHAEDNLCRRHARR